MLQLYLFAGKPNAGLVICKRRGDQLEDPTQILLLGKDEI